MARRLTMKVRAFIENYLITWNASEAARQAGYDPKYAGVIGAANLRDPVIRAEIEKRLEELAMTSNEVLARLGQQARATVEDFLTFPDDGSPPFLDLKRAHDEGKLHLLRRVKLAPVVEIELHDSQAALVHLGRALKLFTDKTEISTAPGESFQVHVYIPDNGRGDRIGDAAVSAADVDDDRH